MAIGANSYGSTTEVAGMVPRYANSDGEFDATTNPTEARIENFIDRVSGVVNGYLSQLGFVVPVTQADAKLMLDNIVIEHVVLMVEGVRGTGRYAPSSKAIANRGVMSIISKEVMEYLETIAVGLEELGATRRASTNTRVGFRQFDERGNETFPMFQRSGFGNSFTNWDSD